MAARTLPIRFSDETIARLDALVEAMTKRTGGMPVARSTVARAAIERGLDGLEAEVLGERKPRRKK